MRSTSSPYRLNTLLTILFLTVWSPASRQAMQVFAETNPALVAMDSDGDGFTDAQERAWNTNPNDPNSHPDLETGLAAWWPLDDGGGTQAADVSDNGLTGTLSGQATWSSDASGEALAFIDAQARVTVSDAPALRPSRALALVAWVNLTGDGVIVAKGSSYALSVVNGRLALKTTVAGQYRPLFGHLPVADGQWHHVACAYDGFEVRLYVDGVRDVATHTGGAITAGDDALVIGQLAGSLRDVGMYQRAFDDGEMKLLFETVSAAPASNAARRQPSAPAFLIARREPPNRVVHALARGTR